MTKSQEFTQVKKIKFPSTKKQQVIHSTFRLSAKAHDAIKALGSVFTKHAEIFDCFDTEVKARLEVYDSVLQNPKHKEIPKGFETLDDFAYNMCFGDITKKLKVYEKNEKIRKTYVLKKETVDNLEIHLKQLKKRKIKINRDFLIEILALHFKEKLDEEKAKIPQLYKSYLRKIAAIWQAIEGLEVELNRELASYDPFDLIGRINYEACGLMNLHQDLESFLAEETKNDTK